MTTNHPSSPAAGNLSRPSSNLAVQKFGGSSLSTPEKIARVAHRVAEEVRKGRRLVLVASAMGGRTDALVQLAGALTDAPPARELDALLATGESASTALLAMALQQLGVPAVSLRGWQAGIRTEGPHGHARIASIDTSRLLAELDAGRVPVVCGFQGQSEAGDVTTLGRGGSDTTAVAVAAALGVTCEIYSDVPGVFSADPRFVRGARLVPCLRYEEMLAYAERGAKVLNEDAVATARDLGVPLHARATFAADEGTLVTSDVPMAPIVGVAMRREVYRIQGGPEAVDGLVRAHHGVQRREVAHGCHEALLVLREGTSADALQGVQVRGPYASVSVVGRRAPKLGDAIEAALDGVNVVAMERWTDETSTTCILPTEKGIDALCALHAALVEGRPAAPKREELRA
ncbi:MAG: aspartate kinase [Sandaracinus sp.]|nr:aspartate kinase [Sandaracinus sp.]